VLGGRTSAFSPAAEPVTRGDTSSAFTRLATLPLFLHTVYYGRHVTACHRPWPGQIDQSMGTDHLDRVLQPHAIEVLGRNSVSVLGHLLDQLWHFHSVVHL
jgi:hypothetical protein